MWHLSKLFLLFYQWQAKIKSQFIHCARVHWNGWATQQMNRCWLDQSRDAFEISFAHFAGAEIYISIDSSAKVLCEMKLSNVYDIDKRHIIHSHFENFTFKLPHLKLSLNDVRFKNGLYFSLPLFHTSALEHMKKSEMTYKKSQQTLHH